MNLPVAARIARRELRGGLSGFWVFLACLALGVAAIAAVGNDDVVEGPLLSAAPSQTNGYHAGMSSEN